MAHETSTSDPATQLAAATVDLFRTLEPRSPPFWGKNEKEGRMRGKEGGGRGGKEKRRSSIGASASSTQCADSNHRRALEQTIQTQRSKPMWGCIGRRAHRGRLRDFAPAAPKRKDKAESKDTLSPRHGREDGRAGTRGRQCAASHPTCILRTPTQHSHR